MKLTARQFRVVSGLAVLEVTRQPLFLILTAVSLALMGFASSHAYQFGEDGKFARDSALAVHFLFGTILGVYAACTVLAREIKTGTASVVLSKPVTKEVFFLAKYLGVAAVVLLFSACAIPGTLLAEKGAAKLFLHDPLATGVLFCAPLLAFVLAGIADLCFKRPFVSVAFWLMLLFVVSGLALCAAGYEPGSQDRIVRGHIIPVDAAIQWRIVPAGALVTAAVLALSAVAFSLATALGTAPVLLLCCGLLFLGLLSDWFFGAASATGAVSALLYRILPNWQCFWMADSLTNKGRVSWQYVAIASTYAALLTGAALSCGMIFFGRREVRETS